MCLKFMTSYLRTLSMCSYDHILGNCSIELSFHISFYFLSQVIIGGDGSLTGANEFRQEWPELLKELVEEGRIKAGEAVLHGHLNIVGMVCCKYSLTFVHFMD